MSSCTFLASEHPLPTARPSREYPLEINIDTGVVSDGGADDNFFLLPFEDVQTYTDKPYGVALQWHYTPGRAETLLKHIENALQHADTIELWHIWLLGYWEWEERPVIHNRTISFSELTAQHIRDLDESPIWNTPDKQFPLRPSFYRLTIMR